MAPLSSYLYIAGTIFFTVYGQLVTKWQVNQIGPMPEPFFEKIGFIFQLLLNPWMISSIVAAFLAFLCWIGAMTKFDLSHAYPFTSLSFVFVLIASGLLFRETISIWKIVGILFIITGVYLGSRG